MDRMEITDSVEYVHTDNKGKIVNHYVSNDSLWKRILVKLHIMPPNCLVNNGFAAVAGLIVTDVGGTAFDYIAIGTVTTGADPTDTALGGEVKRKAATGTRVQTSVANDTSEWYVAFSSADGLSGSQTITEIGVLNAAASGTLLMRQTFPAEVMNWDSGDTLSTTIKVQIKQGT